MKKQILICTTIIHTVRAFLIPHIKLLNDMGFEVDVAANFDNFEGNESIDSLVREKIDLKFQRTPFSIKNIEAARNLKEIVKQKNYHIVHFHTPVASAFGRFYIRDFRRKGVKVIYTTHGLHFYKGAPKSNWLTYYPVERYLSGITDGIITINQADFKMVKAKLKCKHNYHINGIGIDVHSFSDVKVDVEKKRSEIGVKQDDLLLLSVGELNKNKNHQVIINAMSLLNSDKIKYVICGDGPERNELLRLACSLSLEDKLILLGNREDIKEICKAANIFLAPSIREGLGIAILEAMSAGLPIIASNANGPKELIKDKKNGLAVNDFSPKNWADAIAYIMENHEKSFDLGKHANETAWNYDISVSLKQMKRIYKDFIDF